LIQLFVFQRHFREAEIYLLRFRQCMTRAMTLIKMYFVGSLRALTADVSRRISEKVDNRSLFILNSSLTTCLSRTYPKPRKCICCIPVFGASLVHLLHC
jgi:hypothetical protein